MIHVIFASFDTDLLSFIYYFDQIHFPGSKEGCHMFNVYRGCEFKRNIGSLILIGGRGAGAKQRAFNLLQPIFLQGLEQSAFRPVSWMKSAVARVIALVLR